MWFTLLLACDLPGPSFVDRRMIDDALLHGDQSTVCVGLDMTDEKVRGYAAETLAGWPEPAACLCESLHKPGKWSEAEVRGMAKGSDDAHVGCAATMLDNPDFKERGELVKLLVGIKVPQVAARLREAAKSDADPEVRAVALSVLHPGKDPEALKVVTSALTDANPAIRAGAATALEGVAGGTEGLVLATKDPDATVRSAAFVSLATMHDFDYAAVACPALRGDVDPLVRAGIVGATRGTNDVAVLACLREHMLEKEDAATVRAALLTTLQKNPNRRAAEMLCEAIPFWVHTYIGEDHPEREGPADIIFAQNNRDFAQSYECVQKAVKVGGYRTCEQKYYINDWFHELGAKNSAPHKCGGGHGGGGGSREITF